MKIDVKIGRPRPLANYSEAIVAGPGFSQRVSSQAISKPACRQRRGSIRTFRSTGLISSFKRASSWKISKDFRGRGKLARQCLQGTGVPHRP